MRLYIDHAGLVKSLQLGPGYKRRGSVAGLLRRPRSPVERRPASVRIDNAAGYGKRYGSHPISSEQREGNGPKARPGVVEAERNRAGTGVAAVSNETRDCVSRDGLVLVLGEMLKLPVQLGRFYIVEMEDREHTTDGAAEKKGRIPTRDQVQHSAQLAATLGERHARLPRPQPALMGANGDAGHSGRLLRPLALRTCKYTHRRITLSIGPMVTRGCPWCGGLSDRRMDVTAEHVFADGASSHPLPDRVLLSFSGRCRDPREIVGELPAEKQFPGRGGNEAC